MYFALAIVLFSKCKNVPISSIIYTIAIRWRMNVLYDENKCDIVDVLKSWMEFDSESISL